MTNSITYIDKSFLKLKDVEFDYIYCKRCYSKYGTI